MRTAPIKLVRRNTVAADLRTPKYRPRVVRSAKRYVRKPRTDRNHDNAD